MEGGYRFSGVFVGETWELQYWNGFSGRKYHIFHSTTFLAA